MPESSDSGENEQQIIYGDILQRLQSITVEISVMKKMCTSCFLLCFILLSGSSAPGLTQSGDAILFSESSRNVPFETIDKGDASYFRNNDDNFHGAEMVIRNRKSWEWFWALHTLSIVPAPPLPKVNFSREMVLVTMLGNQSSHGPDITVSSVEQMFSENVSPVKGIRVLVKENREPGFQDVSTNPYHIVRVTKTDAVVFEHEPLYKICSENSGCGEGAYCSRKVGACTGDGICSEMPDTCGQMHSPVCGCDGRTYGNECEAAAAGVSVAQKKACAP
jgi:hypothetical protein